MLERLRALYERLVLDAPWAALLLAAGALLLAASQLDEFRLDASADSLLLENDPDLRYFRGVQER